jgi:hypothetical protein
VSPLRTDYADKLWLRAPHLISVPAKLAFIVLFVLACVVFA